MSVAEENVGEMVYPNEVEVKDEVETLMNALENPVGSGSFDAFLKNAKDILIIVNDGTRPTPTSKVLDMIHPKIKGKNFKIGRASCRERV